MKVAYKTDVGKKRINNEDSVLVDESMSIFLLADGMGGHQAGEVASGLAVKECYTCLTENYDKAMRGADISNLFIESLSKAHDTIQAMATTDVNLKGMGTTLMQMLVINNEAHICNIGDSRAYLLRKELEQITEDHISEVYVPRGGIITEANTPLQKIRVLTQAVGGYKTLVPQLEQVILIPGDILLLCSDGLTDMLSDKEIEPIIQMHRDNLPAAVDMLIQEANNKGGVDNISVILVACE